MLSGGVVDLVRTECREKIISIFKFIAIYQNIHKANN